MTIGIGLGIKWQAYSSPLIETGFLAKLSNELKSANKKIFKREMKFRWNANRSNIVYRYPIPNKKPLPVPDPNTAIRFPAKYLHPLPDSLPNTYSRYLIPNLTPLPNSQLNTSTRFHTEPIPSPKPR